MGQGGVPLQGVGAVQKEGRRGVDGTPSRVACQE